MEFGEEKRGWRRNEREREKLGRRKRKRNMSRISNVSP